LDDYARLPHAIFGLDLIRPYHQGRRPDQAAE
jgi:hypothetical protein